MKRLRPSSRCASSILPTVAAAIVNTVAIADDSANGPDSRPENSRDTVSPDRRCVPQNRRGQRATLIDDADGTGAGPGDKLRYTLHVENQGKVPATLVELTNAPGSCRALGGGLGHDERGRHCDRQHRRQQHDRRRPGHHGAGAQVDVTFDVVIVAPLPVGVTQISGQSSVTGGNFAQVFSDDPDTAAPAESTQSAADGPAGDPRPWWRHWRWMRTRTAAPRRAINCATR
ncbi:MAG: hypothetical protein R3A10_00855 [Caldilineaceae bacterium]